MKTLLLLVACSVCGELPPTPAAWTQWRGSNRDGVVDGSGLPTVWPQQPPTPKWSARVGEGHSSPVAAGGRVFVMGREKNGQESCVCLDEQTGRKVWRHTYATSFRPPDPNAGMGPKSTPTIDGDRLYTFGSNGMLHCLDIGAGRVLWVHDCMKEYWGVEKDSSGDDAWFPCCGVAASPIVDGTQAIVPIGGKKAGAFAGFDRQTGTLLWSSLPDRSSYGSPIFAQLAQRRQLIGFTGLRMVGLDAATHELLWQCPFPAEYEQTILTPVVWQNRVIIGGEKRPTVAVEVTSDGGRIGLKKAWECPQLRAYTTSPVVLNDHHLVGLDSRTNRLVCVDLNDGSTTWTSDRVGGHAAIVRAGQWLITLNSDGELFVAEAAVESWKPVAKWVICEAGGTRAHPAIFGSRIFIKDQQQITCYDLSQSGGYTLTLGDREVAGSQP